MGFSDYRSRLLGTLHDYCTREGVGTEYMLLLLLSPAQIVAEHRVLPQVLFYGLLKHLQGTSEYVDDTVSESFRKDLCLYVKNTAAVSDPATSLVGDRVDILRGCLQLEEGASWANCLGYMVRELEKVGAVSNTDGVRAQVSTEGRFSIYFLSSAVVQATVIDILRSRAKGELNYLMAGRRASGRVPLCKSVSSLAGEWDGVFSESEAPEGNLSYKSATPATLAYNQAAGAFHPDATPCVSDIRQYDKPIRDLVTQYRSR
eukprot:108809-Rhodomonas_salina.1